MSLILYDIIKYMKRVKLLVLSLVLAFAPFLSINPAFANANDFYFKNFTADYYLKKQADNTSEMEVVEEMTAVFPNYDQNHGIERTIPFLNQNDTNLTMESTDELEIEATRNGEKEPVSVTAYNTYFKVRIGDPSVYLHGEQTYVLKYKFIHVITEFDVSQYSENAYQELYWDANGTGWDQAFNSVTVNLHMENSIYNNLKTDLSISKTPSYQNKTLIHENNTTKDGKAAWCYVGRYGASNQDRCKISDLTDGISFKASDLSAGENLTFVTNFNENTFTVPENDFISALKLKEGTVDYYLSRDADGLSHVKVKEEITADFPTLNEVTGFNRSVYYVRGSNFITDRQDGLDIKVTMDGEAIDDPAVTNDESTGRYIVTVSDESETYLHGEHTLTLEYDLKNVISNQTQPVEKDSEELLEYQDFNIKSLPMLLNDIDKMTVNVHLSDELKSEVMSIREGVDNEEMLSAVCIDGSAQETTLMSCTKEETSDGYTFSTNNLSKKNSFITIVHFKNGTFTVPEPNRNYLYCVIFGLVFSILAIIVAIFYRKNVRPVKDRIEYLKNKPVAPQYTPLKGYTAAQLAQAYIKPTKNSKVATMLELVIAKKIELIKGEKKFLSNKYKWRVKFIDLTGLSNEQMDLLRILNHGETPVAGGEVELTNHAYSSAIDNAFNSYDTHVKNTLENAGWIEKKEKKHNFKLYSPEHPILSILGWIAAIWLGPYILMVVIWAIVRLVSWILEATDFTPFSIYEGSWLLYPMILMTLAVFAILPILSIHLARYKSRTEAGLDVSNYMEGLKLYIKMAEAERLKFLQSVKGVDTSEAGIVKLNEKLLPYAALFGLEKSWMKELEKYYELHAEATPDWYVTGFSYSIVNSAVKSAVSRPIDTSSSGSGSDSSGFSGGGGGGFSGGGGGGGGGGGW